VPRRSRDDQKIYEHFRGEALKRGLDFAQFERLAGRYEDGVKRGLVGSALVNFIGEGASAMGFRPQVLDSLRTEVLAPMLERGERGFESFIPVPSAAADAAVITRAKAARGSDVNAYFKDKLLQEQEREALERQAGRDQQTNKSAPVGTMVATNGLDQVQQELRAVLRDPDKGLAYRRSSKIQAEWSAKLAAAQKTDEAAKAAAVSRPSPELAARQIAEYREHLRDPAGMAEYRARPEAQQEFRDALAVAVAPPAATGGETI